MAAGNERPPQGPPNNNKDRSGKGDSIKGAAHLPLAHLGADHGGHLPSQAETPEHEAVVLYALALLDRALREELAAWLARRSCPASEEGAVGL